MPLTLADALTHVDRFPLFVQWTPVRQGGRTKDTPALAAFHKRYTDAAHEWRQVAAQKATS